MNKSLPWDSLTKLNLFAVLSSCPTMTTREQESAPYLRDIFRGAVTSPPKTNRKMGKLDEVIMSHVSLLVSVQDPVDIKYQFTTSRKKVER